LERLAQALPYAGGVRELTPVTPEDRADLTQFLHVADLTVSGLDSPSVRLWVARDAATAEIVGSTGFELSADRRHALIRSVAVDPRLRGEGHGLALARFAISEAATAGAHTAWLFSRRSGPFWQKLGFTSADRTALATALATTEQVRLFAASGQLEREIAWSMTLEPPLS
jgi:N-acetylglutamate synthase-like GNAT family acetyltransferase